MDPHAKRFLWRQIGDVINSGKTAIMLTTHSMEECEALCGRVAILMAGRLVGLGSIQHLKMRFGTGYTIEIRAAPVSAAMVQTKRRLLQGVEMVTKSNVAEVSERLGGKHKHPFEKDIPVRQFLKAWIEESLAETVLAYISLQLPSAKLKSRHGPHILFEIRQASLADLFDIMEHADGVEHYAISQTTLEEIFNAFAHRQYQQKVTK
jgi:ATP-binding cassette, subfamily A (ABC1), member 3